MFYWRAKSLLQFPGKLAPMEATIVFCWIFIGLQISPFMAWSDVEEVIETKQPWSTRLCSSPIPFAISSNTYATSRGLRMTFYFWLGLNWPLSINGSIQIFNSIVFEVVSQSLGTLNVSMINSRKDSCLSHCCKCISIEGLSNSI